MDFVNIVNYKIIMDIKLNETEYKAQIIRHEDIANHNNRAIYMRDEHCDWGSSGMKELAETLDDSK